jgi:hypothetical protein
MAIKGTVFEHILILFSAKPLPCWFFEKYRWPFALKPNRDKDKL